MKYLSFQDKFEIIESLAGEKFKAIIIKAGKTLTANTVAKVNGNDVPIKKYYSEDVLKEAAANGIFEGVPVLFRSETEHLSGKNDSTKNVIGWFNNTGYDETLKGVTGIFNFRKGNDIAESFKGKFKDFWNKTKDLGLSIYAYGKWNIEKMENEFVASVKKITDVFSIDPCEIGNAGGRLLELIESKEDSDLINTLNKYFPNLNANKMKLNAKQKQALFDLLVKNGKIKDSTIDKITDEQIIELCSGQELAGILSNPEYGDPPAPANADPKPPANADPKPPANADPKPPENADPIPPGLSKEEIEDMKKVAAESKLIVAKNKLNEILSESKLPKNVTDKIYKRIESEKFVFSEVALKQELKDTAEILAESITPEFNFGGQPKIKMEARDRFQLALDWLIFSSKVKNALTDAEKKEFAEAGIDNSVHSMRRIYTEMTGDVDITGYIEKRKLAESIISSSYTEMLGLSMKKAMLKEFQLSPYGTDWKKICDIVSTIDYKENSRIYKGGYGDVPTVTEGSAFLSATTPAEEVVKYSMSKKGYTEDITREALLNDDLKQFQNIPKLFGKAAMRTLYKFVFNLFLSNPSMLYDSTTLFHINHNNLLTDALGKLSLEEARKKLYNQVELTTLEIMGLTPKYLICSDTLRQTAYELLTFAYGLQNQVPEFVQTLQIEPIIVAHLSDANDWYLLADPLDNPMIEISFLNGVQDPQIFIQDMPNVGTVFTNDKITFKLRHEYNGCVLNHRGFVKSAVPNA